MKLDRLSMNNHGIRGAGLSGLSLEVTLCASDNSCLTYPVRGVLKIIEQGTTLAIIAAIFHTVDDAGKLGPPVRVGSPAFAYGF